MIGFTNVFLAAPSRPLCADIVDLVGKWVWCWGYLGPLFFISCGAPSGLRALEGLSYGYAVAGDLLLYRNGLSFANFRRF